MITAEQTLTLQEIQDGNRPWDFPVQRQPLRASGIEHTRDAVIRPAVFDEIEKCEKPVIIGEVGRGYEVVSFHRLLIPVLTVLEAANGNPTRTRIRYTEINHGEQAHWRITFGEDIDFGRVYHWRQQRMIDENLSRMIDFNTGYTAGYGVRAWAGFEQRRCTNGLIVKTKASTFSLRHQSWDDVAYAGKVEELLDSVLAEHEDAMTEMRSWTEIGCGVTTTKEILDALTKQKYPTGYLNEAARATIDLLSAFSNTPDELPSIWDFYSILTNAQELSVLKDISKQRLLNGKTFETLKAKAATLREGQR